MRLKKSIKNKISTFAILTSTSLGMASFGMAASALNGKIKLNKEIDQKKIEYYEKQTRINNSLIKNQLDEYNKKVEEFRKKKIKELYSEITYIPDEYRYQIINNLKDTSNTYNYGIISQEDLDKITSLELVIGESKDLDFLKKCTNLEELKIYCAQEDIIFLNFLPTLTNIKKLELNASIYTLDSNMRELIYTKLPCIEDLNLPYTITFEPGVIESLNQIKKLSINPSINCDINFNELTHLEELVINSERPYDIAIWLNKEEYNTLKDNNVKITFKENIEEKYLEISEKLENILNSLEINENSSDEEILDEILKYAIKNYQYDEVVANATAEEKRKMGIPNIFYNGGELYATLEKDTQICGNYAAFVEAMYDRIKKPEQSYILTSVNHAWNLVDIEGKKYFVDSTWLDERTITYNEEQLTSEEAADINIHKYMHWYKEDPNSDFIKQTQEQNESHIIDNMVNYEKDTYTKTDFEITQPVITTTTTTTTTEPVFTILTERINTENLDQQKTYFENLYNKEINKYSKTGAILLALALFLSIKRELRNKKEENIKNIVKVKKI